MAGAPTGVMDQMASLHGRAGHLVFLDTRSLAVEPVPFDPAVADLALLVIDTKAPHALVDGEYAERHRSCARATEQLGVTALRDVPVDGLNEALARLDDELLRSGCGTWSPRTPGCSTWSPPCAPVTTPAGSGRR